MTVRLQREDFDPAAEAAKLTRGRSDIGAVVTFTGICRGAESGEPIAALTLEHYPGMAEAEISRHVDEAKTRWPLLGVTVIHRYGRLMPGENIVLVVTEHLEEIRRMLPPGRDGRSLPVLPLPDIEVSPVTLVEEIRRALRAGAIERSDV